MENIKIIDIDTGEIIENAEIIDKPFPFSIKEYIIVVFYISMFIFPMLLIINASSDRGEIEGTVRDKYISESNSHLLVDSFHGEVYNWSIISEVYESCEIGNTIHRSADGNIFCS